MALSLGAVSATVHRWAKKMHYFVTNIADTVTLASGDVIVAYDASNNYEPFYTTVGNITLDPAINAPVTVTDAASYSVLAANTGKIHICPDFTASCTMTLPAGVAGMYYFFEGKGVAADAQNWVFTSPSPLMRGGVAFADNDAGAGADEIHAGIYPNGSSHVTLTITTPAAGTYVSFLFDGTSWIANGWVNSATAPAFS